MVLLTAKTFIENLAQELANNKWDAEEIRRNVDMEGTNFDLCAARKSAQYWRAFVMTLPQFIDEPTFQECIKIYDGLKNKVKSWWIGDNSILCIIAEKGVSPDVIPKVNDYSVGFIQLKSGGCLLCIADVPKKATYMKVPGLPILTHQISGEFREIISRALSK